MGAAIAPARPFCRERPKTGVQGSVIGHRARLAALGRAVLPGDVTRPPLRQSEALLEGAPTP